MPAIVSAMPISTAAVAGSVKKSMPAMAVSAVVATLLMALMRTKDGQKWLVGSDGSTQRVYYMPVPESAKTCREAHEAISGLNEDQLLMEA